MNNLLEKIKKDRLDKAVESIKGYCEKHLCCSEDCRFFDKEENECVFERSTIPCDWSDNNA